MRLDGISVTHPLSGQNSRISGRGMNGSGQSQAGYMAVLVNNPISGKAGFQADR